MQHVHLKVHRQAFHVAQDVENLPTDLELVRQIKAFVFLFTISGDQKKCLTLNVSLVSVYLPLPFSLP